MLRYLKPIVFLLPPLLLVVMAGLSTLLQPVDRFIYDLFSRHYSPVAISNNSVVLIDIDRASIEAYSGWPLDRAVHAQAIDILSAAQASSITYNVAFIAFNPEDKASDRQLLRSIQSSGKVVLPMIAEAGTELLPLAGVKTLQAKVAHVDLSLDEDKLLRRHYMHAGIGYPRWPSLSLATLSMFAPVKADDFAGLRSPFVNLGFSELWSRDYEALIPMGINAFIAQVPRYSLKALLDGEVDTERLINKAVFIGIADAELEEQKALAQGHFSATEVHAFNFAALNQGYVLSPSLPLWAIGLALLVSVLVGFGLLFQLPLVAKAVALSFAAGLALLPLYMLSLGYWLSYMPMLVGVSAVVLVALLQKITKKP